MSEDFRRRPGLEQLAADEHRNPVAEHECLITIVRDEHCGDTRFA